MSEENKQGKLPERKVSPIIALVFGAIALALSWMPIINNIAAVFAVVGVILGLISLVVNRKHKKVLTWVGLVISIASFAIVLIAQNSFSKSIDNATSEVAKDSSADEESESSSSTKDAISGKTFKVGDTVTYKGVEFKVNSFNFKPDDPDTTILKDGNQFAIANVTITNKSDKSVSYNSFDFQLDNNGNTTDMMETDIDNNNELDSGDLKPGATVSGDLIGQANPADKLKLDYKGNMFDDEEAFTIDLN